jgi:glutamyl-tRNA synthetase
MVDILRSRIAPTPSGFLHIGNAYNFLLTEAIVRKANGRLRLRIDDLDALRLRREYLEDIFESLAWLDIVYDEGPMNIEEQDQQFSQRFRVTRYNEVLRSLVDTGLVFACNCSRKDLQQTTQDGQYPGTCLSKNIPLDAPDVSWRIQTPKDASMVRFYDKIIGAQHMDLWDVQRHFVVRRRDGLPAYHVASLSDDADYGINTIVRGEDLLSSTGAQLYLAGLLRTHSFTNATLYHHPLLRDRQGGKLSKSAGSTSLRAMRAAGTDATVLREQAASWYTPLL